MSKELQTPQQSSEEVDLGQLFKLIGNAFDRFFKFIESIFKGIFHVVLLLLTHFYKRFVWYVGAVVLGVVAGFIIDKNSDTLYGANMYIETNFNSARQVYENLKEMHQLAYEDKDSIELANRLNITPSEAASLKGFYIEPDIDENKRSEMYSLYFSRLDSITQLEMTYDKFKDALTDYNFNIHRIGVASINKSIFKKIEKKFEEELVNNTYLEELKNVNQENLTRKEQSLSIQVKKTDSLIDMYLKIRMKESDKEAGNQSGTTLYMGDADSGNLVVDESKVLDKRLDLESQLRGVFKDKVEQDHVVNVLAGFPKTGYDISDWTSKKKIVLPIVLLGLTLILFVLLGISKYIKEQTK
ncbi:hypothetical protein [Aestuariibaculum lutulentum]|uniref:Polysaccharide chain length determinant N-terminal domain-containing protein n=1 Tax=Aestuariibaculum lutulentum TaxID=2920935 RepID=A0ABS9RGQ1_9FLAO|nr:hypothetical protein [Aestuariibaculum lutulentum]MCH4552123.1 hypothetical protein [Aestuariibaculum lutulentum]